MALAASKIKAKGTGGIFLASFTLTPSGSYATGGDSIDFVTSLGYTNRQPDFVTVIGKAGFVYMYDYTAKKLLVFCNTAGGADAALGELSAGAYPVGVTGDVIRGMVAWIGLPKLT